MREDESIMLAMLALKRCRTQLALYWINGRIRATQAESSHYQSFMSDYMPNLIGVYSAKCNPQLIADDIATLYQ